MDSFPSHSSCLTVLSRHQRRLQARLAELDRLDGGFSLARMVTFIGGSAVTLLAVFAGPDWLVELALAISVAVFSAVVYFHRRLDRTRQRFRLAADHAASQLARMNLEWDALPASPRLAREDGASHPFAQDLNLTGERSLHRLVDSASSLGGSQLLGDWLLNITPDLATIHSRQAILQEMQPLTGFRYHLALRGRLVREQAKGHWDGEKLLGWLAQDLLSGASLPVLILLFVLAIANLSLFALNLLGVLPPYWTVSLTLYAGIYFYKFRTAQALFDIAYTLGKSLSQFREILLYLEQYPFSSSPHLEQVCASFRGPGQRPSVFLRKIVWITSAASLGANQFFALILNILLPWNLLFAYILDRYKESLRASLAVWLAAWYQVEALSSLANFAYLNPEYVFPRVQADPQVQANPQPGQPVFAAQALGHPLIKEGVRVSNDFSIHNLGDVVIITGSNMSGKSTFLRTLGINLCLAFAGGPVCADGLQTRIFRVFTSIQVSDSLSDGISYFYAEVRRLKALLDALHDEHAYPLFFLIDEIFRGTNNRERWIGSQAYVRALARGSGVGAISTHDLELVHLQDEIPNLVNYHFREQITAGRMQFDYQLRPGPSPTTNALKIMELEGLPVDAPPAATSED